MTRSSRTGSQTMRADCIQTRESAPLDASAMDARTPWRSCVVVGLGGLFHGVTGPLLSTFVPILVRDAIGDHRSGIGAVMAIDNVLLLLLVPFAGVASDRSVALGRGRMPLVYVGLSLAALGMATFPLSAAAGLPGIVAAMVLLYSGINAVRSPLHALVPDLVPSRHRSLAQGSFIFQMYAGAILFLMLGRAVGMRVGFLVASATILAIAGTFALALREPREVASSATETTYGALVATAAAAFGGTLPGLRAMFAAALLLNLTFQTFTTWFALHGTERFGLTAEDVTVGFIAWSLGGILGALPAGFIGTRLGRRNAMLAGFALLALCLGALHLVTTLSQLVPLLMLASAAWALPAVNAYPLFVEPIPRERRGALAALFLLAMALGGAIGDPLNGAAFDLARGYRPMFLLMAAYTALAIGAVVAIPRGAGEAR